MKNKDYNVYIFDVDGTLRTTKSGKVCPSTLGDQYLLPGEETKFGIGLNMKKYRKANWS